MKFWLRRRRTLIPLHEVGGITVIERKNEKDEIVGYQMAIMVDRGILPIQYGAADGNEVDADLAMIHEELDKIRHVE